MKHSSRSLREIRMRKAIFEINPDFQAEKRLGYECGCLAAYKSLPWTRPHKTHAQWMAPRPGSTGLLQETAFFSAVAALVVQELVAVFERFVNVRPMGTSKRLHFYSTEKWSSKPSRLSWNIFKWLE